MKNLIFTMLIAMISTVSLLLSAAAMAEEDCQACHVLIMEKKFKHQAVEMGCTSCHAEHGTETGNPFRLVLSPNKLCFNCHDAKAMRLEGGHWIQNHPVEKRQDPLFPEKKFSCVSCHNPHSSNQEKLFRYNVSGPEFKPVNNDRCAVCHWAKFSDAPQPPTPPWNDEAVPTHSLR